MVEPANSFDQHLQTLGGRESWRVYELPPKINEGALRVLDKRGYVEVCLWQREDMVRISKGFESAKAVRKISIGWFSPVRQPGKAGPWGKILAKYQGEYAPEIRVSEHGKARLTESAIRAKKTKGTPKKPKQRRKRLTDREREVLRVYSECGRNAAEAARQLGVRRQYVWKVVTGAQAKVKSTSASGRSKRADQTLPTDSDGQESISEQLGKADTTRSRKTHVRERF